MACRKPNIDNRLSLQKNYNGRKAEIVFYFSCMGLLGNSKMLRECCSVIKAVSGFQQSHKRSPKQDGCTILTAPISTWIAQPHYTKSHSQQKQPTPEVLLL